LPWRGGYERATTPHLDRLAKDGVLFESAYSQSSWTLPSHTSMFTGLDPDAHGDIGEDERERPRALGYVE
jgi:arylsulfatase A-like enzyme